MSMGAMMGRLLPALGALALLIAVIGCGGDEQVYTVVSGESATHVRASSPVSEGAPSLPSVAQPPSPSLSRHCRPAVGSSSRRAPSPDVSACV